MNKNRAYQIPKIVTGLAIGLLVLGLFLLLAFTFSQRNVSSVPATNDTEGGSALLAREHTLGNRAADVRVILYSDTECPFCNSFMDYSLPKILDEYGKKIAIVYRHYPIVALHPNAKIEAEAAECAYEQRGENGFWVFLDTLYREVKDENTLNVKDMPRIAGLVGLDPVAMESCVQKGGGRPWVEQNMKQAALDGVYKTPTVLVKNIVTGKSILIGGAGYSATKAAIETVK